MSHGSWISDLTIKRECRLIISTVLIWCAGVRSDGCDSCIPLRVACFTEESLPNLVINLQSTPRVETPQIGLVFYDLNPETLGIYVRSPSHKRYSKLIQKIISNIEIILEY